MNYQVKLIKLREMLVQAENGGMTNELLDDIEKMACDLFTPDVIRLTKALAADAREWRRRVGDVAKTMDYSR